MDATEVRNLVLLNASEEAGLFEVIWDLGSKFPESDLWQRYQAAVEQELPEAREHARE